MVRLPGLRNLKEDWECWLAVSLIVFVAFFILYLIRQDSREKDQQRQETENVLATVMYVPDFSQLDAWDALQVWWREECPDSLVFLSGVGSADLVVLDRSFGTNSYELAKSDVQVQVTGPFKIGEPPLVSLSGYPEAIEVVCGPGS